MLTKNYRSCKNLLEELEGNEKYLSLANHSHQPEEELKLKEKLEDLCFNLDYLGITDMRSLRKRIDSMSANQIKRIERINGISIDEVIKKIDQTISSYVRESKIKREIKELMKEKDKEFELEMLEKEDTAFENNNYYAGRKKNALMRARKAEVHKKIEEEVRRRYEL